MSADATVIVATAKRLLEEFAETKEANTEVLQATRDVRRILSTVPEHSIDSVIEAGLVPLLVLAMQSYSSDLALESCWAITNIASGTSEQTHFVVQCHAVPTLIRLLRDGAGETQLQAVWALSNIAGDSPQCRDLVLDSGVVPPLVQMFLHCVDLPVALLRNVVWLTSNLARGQPSPPLERTAPLLPGLSFVMHHCQDDETLKDACWALAYYMWDGENNRIQAVLDSGCLPAVIRCAEREKHALITPVLRCLCNVLSGDDNQTQAALEMGVIDLLDRVIAQYNECFDIVKEACRGVSNITAGSHSQIQLFLDRRDFVLSIAGLYDVYPREDLLEEIIWVFGNLGMGSTVDQKKLAYEIMGDRLMQLFVFSLRSENAQHETALKSLKKWFSGGKALQKREMRQKRLARPPRNIFVASFRRCSGNDQHVYEAVRSFIDQEEEENQQQYLETPRAMILCPDDDLERNGDVDADADVDANVVVVDRHEREAVCVVC